MTDSIIQARNMSSCIGKHNILKEISFDIPRQSLTSVLGPSGSGKTTLLQTIAGFQPICQGELLINDVVVSRRNQTVAPDRRNVGMVFQDHALFPHLSVLENIKTALRSRRANAAQLDRLVEKLHLGHLQHRHPHELSGGQQQRTALARALIARPEIILLDEPFANLNQDLQIEVGIELVDILREQKTTAIMVTHDQNDAMAISDYIIMLSQGRHIQSGTPQALYHQPATREVASFLSRGSFIRARYLGRHKADTPLGTVDIELAQGSQPGTGDELDIWLHPEDILIDTSGHEVNIIHQSWRPLDLLVKVRTANDEELLVKADQQPELIQAGSLQVRLNNNTSYSAFT